ncbi:DUF4301 family protein [Xanthovirga aplysinae]|uniref:DUF4301 family protein n=1 Tax=Xanthovirga aplysinae TaxID=2529853 RepID=UPI0012BBD385|nr:DUF4301 family protein [Xanthovirga aplysinae]MTI32086.1 DUF4301 family protein [Xanthovirga aplysinae]
MQSTLDLELLNERGIKKEQILAQLNQFKKGIAPVKIEKAASERYGILKLTSEEGEDYSVQSAEKFPGIKIVKFVPASGAASRMFKKVFQYLKGDESVALEIIPLVDRLKDFAFYRDLEKFIKEKAKLFEGLDKKTENAKILEALVGEEGLSYGSLPKGLLKFHKYAEKETRTAFEEHLVEGALYAQGADQKVHVHFTVSPEHQMEFDKLLAEVKKYYEDKYKVLFEVDFSQQKCSTDTIAVNLNNEPFRTSDGKLLFRPSGHGALLENLNDIDADLIFIKNIDNVQHDRFKDEVQRSKKVIAGVLLEYQDTIFSYLDRLDDEKEVHEGLISEIGSFYQNKLFTEFSQEYLSMTKSQKLDYLRSKLNRPIRVCGMVLNEGEPGGGPFLVRNADNSVSLQVVETAQMDKTDPKTKEALGNATHFNPVDLVCGVKNYKGEKFNLLKYRDPDTGFISIKSKEGVKLKALELPGLWNGAMADWNTIFVEVPAVTFSPVKEVSDLLRDAHQEKKGK